jgi:hypothetical protein
MNYATVEKIAHGRAYVRFTKPTEHGLEVMSFRCKRVLDACDGKPWHTRALQTGEWEVGDMVALNYQGTANGYEWKPIWCVPAEEIGDMVDVAVTIQRNLKSLRTPHPADVANYPEMGVEA